MKLGIVSHSKLLTVFIRENMTRGLFSHVEGMKVTHGKLWGNLICLFEPEGDADLDSSHLINLWSDYKIGQVLSLGIGRTVLPVLDSGDIIVASEAVLWQSGPGGEPVRVGSVDAPPKLLDRVINSFERHRSDEVGSRAIVGSLNSYLDKMVTEKQSISSSGHNVQFWDRDGFYLAEYCAGNGIPWALIRLILNEEVSPEKVSPAIKWDMAKKCFWIVKGILESNNRSNINKGAR